MARALTSPELAYVRGPRQRTRLFVDADVPPVVFAAQVNQTFSTKDMVLEVTWNNRDTDYGVHTDVLVGQTLLVGSQPLLDDLGQCRIRKAADATRLYIGLTSEIGWANDLYLTVIDEFRLWAKPAAIAVGGAILMDGDVAWSDQNTNFTPVIVAGPARRVAKLTDAFVDIAFDQSDSWCPGSSLSSWSCAAPGSASITGGTTDAPVVRYDTEGRYRVAFTGTAANGKSKTVYRTVRIYSDDDPLLTVFAVSDAAGDDQEGGWRMGISAYLPESGLGSVPRHAMITLVAEDWYDETKVSIGPIAGSENVVAIGWAASEEIHGNPRTGGSVKFDVYGPQYWLGKIAAPLVELDNTTAAAASWKEIQELTVDKALAHYVQWRSTIGTMLDVYPSGDTRVADQLAPADVALWAQLAAIGKRILAKPLCDRYGRLFMRIPPNLVPEGSRSGIPDVLTVAKSDWRDEIVWRRNPPTASRIEQIGSLISGATKTSLYSLSAGHVPKHYGGQAMAADADLLVSSQAQANEFAGLRLGEANHESEFEIPVAQNNRMVDLCPEQYVPLTIAAGDTPRGIPYDGRMVVRHIEMHWEAKSGFLWFSWSGGQESFAEEAVNGDIPLGDGTGDTIPPIPPPPPPPIVPPPPPPTPPPGSGGGSDPTEMNCAVVLVSGYNGNGGVYYTKNFTDAVPVWIAMNTGLPSADTIARLIVTQSGNLYCMDSRYVYYAAKVGDAWTAVFDIVSKLSGPGAQTMHAIGFIKGTDIVMVLGSGTLGIPQSRRVWAWRGAQGTGWVRTDDETADGIGSIGNSIGFYGDLEFMSSGRYVWVRNTYPDLSGLGLATLNAEGETHAANGATLSGSVANPEGNVLGHGPYAALAAVLKKTHEGGGLSPSSHLTVLAGTAWSSITPPGLPYEQHQAGSSYGGWFESIAVNRAGDKLLLGISNILGLRRSIDGGLNWTSALGIGGSVMAVCFLGDDGQDPVTDYWIFTMTGSQVRVTTDLGDSYVDHTGNLLSLAGGASEIRLIRAWYQAGL